MNEPPTKEAHAVLTNTVAASRKIDLIDSVWPSLETILRDPAENPIAILDTQARFARLLDKSLYLIIREEQAGTFVYIEGVATYERLIIQLHRHPNSWYPFRAEDVLNNEGANIESPQKFRNFLHMVFCSKRCIELLREIIYHCS